jgi:hypothetical protein
MFKNWNIQTLLLLLLPYTKNKNKERGVASYLSLGQTPGLRRYLSLGVTDVVYKCNAIFTLIYCLLHFQFFLLEGILTCKVRNLSTTYTRSVEPSWVGPLQLNLTLFLSIRSSWSPPTGLSLQNLVHQKFWDIIHWINYPKSPSYLQKWRDRALRL